MNPWICKNRSYEQSTVARINNWRVNFNCIQLYSELAGQTSRSNNATFLLIQVLRTFSQFISVRYRYQNPVVLRSCFKVCFAFFPLQVYDAVAWRKDSPETWARCLSSPSCFQPALRTRPATGAQGETHFLSVPGASSVMGVLNIIFCAPETIREVRECGEILK